jgi:hypothetical protein
LFWVDFFFPPSFLRRYFFSATFSKVRIARRESR